MTEEIIGVRPVQALPKAPLALYIHVPWCLAKCPYCDFNSHVLKGTVPAEQFVAAVLADLVLELARRPSTDSLVSIYFGGGTPSLLAPERVADLLDGVREQLRLEADAEISLEANPGTVERGRFAGYAAAGVNRVSLGVQSFDDVMLRRLGRIHTSVDAARAVDELKSAGIENYNLDLMYGLPEQAAAGAWADVERAVSLGPTHISYYELTMEPGTPFFRHPPKCPPETEVARIEAGGRRRLKSAGYSRYEVSAFARDGYRSVHNMNYWRFGDYIGLGPGAHGKRSSGASIVRTARVRSPDRYLHVAGTPTAIAAEETVEGPARAFEFLLNALRLIEGFSWPAFEEGTALPRAVIEADVARAVDDGLLEVRGDAVRASRRGMQCLNELLGRFLEPIS